MTAVNVPQIGSQLGHIISFEESVHDGVLMRTFLRIGILIPIDKPLKLGFWLHKPNDNRYWIKFKYERLQHFCYGCGLLGYEQRECNNPRTWALGPDTSEYKRYNAKLGVAPAPNLHTTKLTSHEQLYSHQEEPQ